MLSERRDEAAATAFFAKTIASNGWPDKVVIDKSGSNAAGLFNMNCLLVMQGLVPVDRRPAGQISQQYHRAGSSFHKEDYTPHANLQIVQRSAAATLAGIEVAHMIRKGQFDRSGLSGFAQFADLAA